MVDRKVMGCCWIELIAGKWYRRNDKITSRCQLEVDVGVNDFVAHLPENEWSTVAPFRILSFDIECAGRKGNVIITFVSTWFYNNLFFIGVFPEANVDPVIQIANIVKLHGFNEYVCCNVFTLKSCAPIGHAQVFK